MAIPIRLILGAWPLLLLLATASACSGNPPPEALPPQSVSPAAPPPAPPPPVQDDTVKTEEEDDTLVVIDESETGSGTLRKAVERERARRDAAGEPVVTITNKNLAEYSSGGELIIVEGDLALPPEESSQAVPEDAPGSPEPGPGLKEEYWRTRALQIRLGWRETVDEMQDLREEIAELRRQFYAEDDPFVRDGQIKPAWDRALDRLAEAREQSESYKRELEVFLEEGRRAGALPGWLREGMEYEPLEDEEESETPGDSREPQIVDEGEG